MLAFFFKEFSGAQIPEGPLQIPQNASSQTNKVLKMLNGWANKTLDTPVAKHTTLANCCLSIYLEFHLNN